jgi:hypothetical protein
LRKSAESSQVKVEEVEVEVEVEVELLATERIDKRVLQRGLSRNEHHSH